ncbi:hypothetical protein FACS189427_02410 [Planctomycetales bacterium]|nr:hypothetical protein FACS189427_02410 [Planctomycetales bacterium]
MKNDIQPKAEPQRVQKVLASAGFGSRRQCEELLIQGRVEVNGSVVPLGTKVNPDEDEIKVDGERLKRSKKVYLALFKPKGFLCTDRDQQGRQRTIDLIPEKFGRLFLIGRLDKDSEGLILATNDGEFSQKLAHPKYGVPKVYRAQVAGEVSLETVKKIKEGVYLSDGFVKAADCLIKGQHKQSTILDLTLTEGMNREVRRLLAKLGHKVQTLFRISVGPIRLGKLAPGEWRLLSREEINAVRKSPLSFSAKKCNNRRNDNQKSSGKKHSNYLKNTGSKTKKTIQKYKKI